MTSIDLMQLAAALSETAQNLPSSLSQVSWLIFFGALMYHEIQITSNNWRMVVYFMTAEVLSKY